MLSSFGSVLMSSGRAPFSELAIEEIRCWFYIEGIWDGDVGLPRENQF